ncbi:unnamed protein product [Cyprideis torosa]|uniref:Uncharacterized protein n=1 Tax=Cyprideis torosa TaxID=163714 RepID=A0A7R8ZIV5_9CRUS|nr:unnamed protein product [Cyprideis torosa]CAG0887086.1 unnamed protein product [Cyprideis torosa]
MNTVAKTNYMSSRTKSPVERNVPWNEMSRGTKCPVERNVPWNEMSPGTKCPLERNVPWNEMSPWIIFYAYNYGTGDVQWAWGLGTCFDLDITYASSIRYVGDLNNHNASTLSFYALTDFRGAGITIQGNVPNLAGFDVNSIITIGGQPYTVYSESNYIGQSICLPPYPDHRPAFYDAVGSIGIPSVGSIAIGCYSDKVARGFSPEKEGLFSFPIKQDN